VTIEGDIELPVTIEGDIGTSDSDLTDPTWCQRARQDGLVRLSEWVVTTSGSGLGRPKQEKEGMRDGLVTSYTSPIADLRAKRERVGHESKVRLAICERANASS
jgi:hypothetical protein